MKRTICGLIVLLSGAQGWCVPVGPAETGFFPEVAVQQPTRLDWEFAAGAFGSEAARAPADYHSPSQAYQLFVPPAYKPGLPAGLVLFVSPGDDPLGWRVWQKTCEDRDLFFASAYGAGGLVPPGRRIHVLFDVLDDLRRRYAIDPAQTYVAGFDNGATIACAAAFSLPEYFGGVIAVSGGAAPFRLDYLRHRAIDRLSVAVVAGENASRRSVVERSFFPLLQELGIRSKLWLPPRTGHELPPPATVAEVQAWLAGDLERRRNDARDHPRLTVGPDEVLTRRAWAERLVAEAEAEMSKPERLGRAAALLHGVTSRWGTTDVADQARKLLKEIQDSPERRRWLAEQAGADERRALLAQARALDRLGEFEAAREAWARLAKLHPRTPEGAVAVVEAKRLAALAAAAPFLGVQFTGQTTVVHAVVPHGPADHAGLQRGDRIDKVGNTPTPSLAELRSAVQGTRPGDKLPLQVFRDGRSEVLTLEVGAQPEKN
jgi:hypothetical protein